MPIITGYNADIDTYSTGSEVETVWPGGGLWVPPTAARVHAIVSSDVDDNSGADTGARTLLVRGLSATYTEQGEVVTLHASAGTTPVNTALAYTHISSMEVLTAGSTGSNEGAITATAATDGTVTAHMVAGQNVTNGCVLVCPAGVYRRITGAGVSPGIAATGDFMALLSVRKASSRLWCTIPLFGILDSGSTVWRVPLDVVLEPGEYARLDVRSSADNQAVHGTLEYQHE